MFTQLRYCMPIINEFLNTISQLHLSLLVRTQFLGYQNHLGFTTMRTLFLTILLIFFILPFINGVSYHKHECQSFLKVQVEVCECWTHILITLPHDIFQYIYSISIHKNSYPSCTSDILSILGSWIVGTFLCSSPYS